MSQSLSLKNEMLAKSWINWVRQLIEVLIMTRKNNRIVCFFIFDAYKDCLIGIF